MRIRAAADAIGSSLVSRRRPLMLRGMTTIGATMTGMTIATVMIAIITLIAVGSTGDLRRDLSVRYCRRESCDPEAVRHEVRVRAAADRRRRRDADAASGHLSDAFHVLVFRDAP